MNATNPVAVARKASDGVTRLFVWCPGCHDHADEPGSLHQIIVEGGVPLWQWDGNAAAPTVSPSLLVTSSWGPEHVERRCHSFIRSGRWEFLSDCTHNLAGQTVDLPPLPDWVASMDES